MPINLKCDTCQQRFRAPDTALGKTVACPHCGNHITIESFIKQLPATPVTLERAKRANPHSSLIKTVVVVFSAVVASFLLIVIGFTVFGFGEKANTAKSSRIQTAPLEHSTRDNSDLSTVVTRDSNSKHIAQGLGFHLERFKRDIPIGDSWKVLSYIEREDGSVSFQLLSTSMSNVLLSVSGNPDNLSEVSMSFASSKQQKESDTLARLAVMAYFLAKYSNWTEEELALFWGRLMQTGAGDESEFKIRKNGHEFWMVAVEVKDGTMFMTGVRVNADSTAPTLQVWLDNHPEPGEAPLN